MPSRQISSTGWQGCSYDSANQRVCLKYIFRGASGCFRVCFSWLAPGCLDQPFAKIKDWRSNGKGNPWTAITGSWLRIPPKAMNQQSASVCLLWTPYIVEKQIGNVEFSFHFWEILFNCIMPRHTAIGCFLLTLSTFRPFNRLLHQIQPNHEVLSSNHDTKKRKQNNASFSFFLGGGGTWNHSSEIHRNTAKSNPSRNTHRNHLTCIFFHRICSVQSRHPFIWTQTRHLAFTSFRSYGEASLIVANLWPPVALSATK